MRISISKKDKPQKLSKQEFLDTFKNVPRLAVNLIITDSQKRILLVRRNIPPCLGCWHLPGSFVLKNEPISDVQIRVAKNELDLELNQTNQLSLLGAFDDLDGDPRGHVVDLVYSMKINNPSHIKPTKETLEVKFFNKLPKNIGFNHKDTLRQLGYTDED